MNARPADEREIRPGAGVDASDGRLGTVDEVRVRPGSGELTFLIVRRGWTDRLLPVAAEHVAGVEADGTVRLRVAREEAERFGAAVWDGSEEGIGGATVSADGERLRVPILAERLTAVAQPVDLGELRIHKRVDQAEESVVQPVQRDEVEVQRTTVNRPLEAPVQSRQEGDWLVIPVMEEVLVVRKQLMLTEEVRVRTRRVTEEREVRETVRRERVELEDTTTSGPGRNPRPASASAPARDTR